MMWSEFFMGYGLFLLKLITVALIFIVLGFSLFALKRHKTEGSLVLKNLSEKYAENNKKMAHFHLDEKALKQQIKAEKKAQKAKEKANKDKQVRKQHYYLLDFKGDINASETPALAKEISAILATAKEKDEVLLRLESPGGVVHGYGLAAAQLMRLKEHQIPLTIMVDKVAASGGYMMACVADKLISAPFAILGSVGVVAQVPNVHRLLKKHDVDVDVMTAGEYKRTLTVLGENTEKGKAKFQQELDETHDLFKQFVAQNRPSLDMSKIATGEHWFGQQALALNLIDEIRTSDDVLMEKLAQKDAVVISVKYEMKKGFLQKVGQQAEETSVQLVERLLQRNSRTHIA